MSRSERTQGARWGGAALLAAALSGCGPSGDSTEGGRPGDAAPAAGAAGARPGEIVFDPTNPPPGWVRCHNNHCHHQDGRVASYMQVMQEMGATRMVGGQAPAAAPPAPPDLLLPPRDAIRSRTGLVSRVLARGRGSRKPGPNSTVSVHFTGWTRDGKAFESSHSRGQPAQFPVNRVFPGWTEGLQLMTVGEERRFWVPEALAFKGAPGRPAGTLVFDVELLSIRD